MSIHLHIERLVLDGIDTGGRPQLLQAAVEAELARLLGPDAGALGGALRQGYALPRLSLPDIGLRGGEPAASLGTRIAAAVASGLGTGTGTGEP